MICVHELHWKKSRPPKLRPNKRLCTRGVEGRSSFWWAHQRDCSLWTTTSSTSRRCLCTANTCTASTLIDYIEQARLAMSGNGTSGSFRTGPASGYFLNFMFMFVVFITSTLDHTLIFTYRYVMIYALIFWIKMNPNWPLIPSYMTWFKFLVLWCTWWLNCYMLTMLLYVYWEDCCYGCLQV